MAEEMKSIWLLMLIGLVVVGLATASYLSAPSIRDDGKYSSDFEALQRIDSWNWINRKEAQLIADSFFWSHISGCGMAMELTRENGGWLCETAIGYAGVSSDPIWIDGRDGSVTWGDQAITLAELQNQTANRLGREF